MGEWIQPMAISIRPPVEEMEATSQLKEGRPYNSPQVFGIRRLITFTFALRPTGGSLRPMTYAEALEHLHGLAVFGARFGLEPTRRLAAALDNPQAQLRFIHVAGTNGKGSTCAMLESIYRAAGYRVGLFTSPHLVTFRERMQVNRRMVSEADVARLVEEVMAGRGRAVAPDEPCGASQIPSDPVPTFFEFVTVMALKWFQKQRCDVVIWETGLGGRLDATNIVTPLASVITNIALDHQEWLGDTLAKIAAEKAGIIKAHIPVLTGADAPQAWEVIRSEAARMDAPVKQVTDAGEIGLVTGAPVTLPLRGAHQWRNAALAAAVVRTLQDKLPVDDSALRHGLETVQWAGRLQVAHVGGREFVLDGAHNPDGVRALRATLQAEFAGQPRALVLGMLADKDCEAMCRELAPLAPRIAAVRVPSLRSLAPEKLA